MPVALARAALSLVALLAALPALAQDVPVREVTLFERGLAEITRSTGEGREVTLRIPLRDVSDVLQSLTAQGEGVTGLRLSLAGETPVEDAFAVLPFRPEAVTSLAALLSEVPGVRVRVSEAGDSEGLVGTVLGVEEECSGADACTSVLSVLGEDGGLRWHAIGEGLVVTILDPEIARALPRGLAVLREAASGMVRDIAVTLEGDVPGEGRLTYVVAAPPWRASYRAVAGPASAVELQAMAMVQNATGEDWEGVRLTLSSGAPKTLAADLHDRNPPEAPAPDASRPDAPEEGGGSRPASGFLGMGFGTAEDSVDRLMPQPPEPLAAGPTGDEGAEARYALDEPVDLGAGQMVSVPLLAEGPEARHLAVWTGTGQDRAGPPEMVLEVTNDLGLRLPPGVVTVSDEGGGFLGDAALPALRPGDTVAVAFGPDRALQVEETVVDEGWLLSASLREGMLEATFEQVHEATYRVVSSAEDREVVIDHPLLEGWDLQIVTGLPGTTRVDEAGQGWMRVILPLGADGASLALRQTRVVEDAHPISHMSSEALLVWAERVPDEGDRALLLVAAPLIDRMYDTQLVLGRAIFARDELVREQERVLRLLDTVPRLSAAHDRFTRRLLDLEEQIAAADEAVQVAEAIAKEVQDAVFSLGRQVDEEP